MQCTRYRKRTLYHSQRRVRYLHIPGSNSRVLTYISLDRLKRNNILSRDDPPYTDMYYRAHWQPLFAYFGLFGCVAIVLFSGWPAIYILASRKHLTGNDDLKG